MKPLKSALAGVKGALTGIQVPALPTLGRVVDIPVYMIHNSSKAEDYFFIFDFEEFVERSREGIFVRPRIKLWAGRDDFDRTVFAGQFRQSFASQFDAARQALNAERTNAGWFSWVNDIRQQVAANDLAAYAANVLLLIGLGAGRMMLQKILPTGLFSSKSEARKLEDSIEDTKSKVDSALAALALVLHRELHDHPYPGAAPTPAPRVVFDAWPLPDHVREHLADRTSGSFW